MWDIRTITEDDADLFRSRLSRGFGGDGDTDEDARTRFRAIFEYDRTFAAFDGEDIIGTGGAFSLQVTVPGGRIVPMGGTTVITVQPTHRRRGVLRALMDSHLQEVADRGEPIAGLWASESSIYGRFGYGPATYRHKAVIDGRAVEMAETFDGSSTVRLLDNDRAEPVIRSVYEAVRSTRTGMLTRSDSWWSHRLMADVESWRGGKSARRYAVFGEDGEVSGYAVYRQKAKWEDFVADGEVDVVEVVTTTTAAHAGLWAFLTSIDLFPRIEYWNLPIDDPLPSLVTDQRRVRRSLVDALWIRLMDVPTALEARRYEADGSVTFETIDPAQSGRSATFRLEVADGNARCTAVQGAPDLTMRADVLGHLYLGGGNALTMARAGRISGDEPSIRALHRLFRTDSMPWCPEVF